MLRSRTSRRGSIERPRPVEGLARRPERAGPIDETRGPGLPADHDVLGDAECRDQRELLVNGDDALALGLVGLREALGLARERDGPGVGPLGAGQDLQQSRLAGAVLAEERQDLAFRELQVDVGQGHHPWKALTDAADLQQRHRERVHVAHRALVLSGVT